MIRWISVAVVTLWCACRCDSVPDMGTPDLSHPADLGCVVGIGTSCASAPCCLGYQCVGGAFHATTPITRTGIGQYTIKLDTAYAAEALDATVSPEAEAITVVAGLVDKTKLRVGHWLHSGATDTITVCITDALGALADAHFSLVARAW